MKWSGMSTNGENQVRNYLEALGFSVTKIPETLEKTPDFLVKDEVFQYVIEVKDKDDQKFIDLLSSHAASNTVNLEYDNTISSIIREGVKQLDSYESQGEAFKALWFFIDPNIFGGSVSAQIGKTLYGLQELEGYKTNGEFFQTLCYYFTFSEFHKNQQLDAVIVQSPQEMVLCMNDFSIQRDKLRQTKLYQSFSKDGLQIIEPSKTRCCVADDFTLDRRNSKAIAEYLGKKYNLKKITSYTYALFNRPLE